MNYPTQAELDAINKREDDNRSLLDEEPDTYTERRIVGIYSTPFGDTTMYEERQVPRNNDW